MGTGDFAGEEGGAEVLQCGCCILSHIWVSSSSLRNAGREAFTSLPSRWVVDKLPGGCVRAHVVRYPKQES